jgi:hypothetical protein
LPGDPGQPISRGDRFVSLRNLASRFRVALALLALVVVALIGAAALSDSIKEPDKLIILSTTDVKGKTSPCG